MNGYSKLETRLLKTIYFGAILANGFFVFNNLNLIYENLSLNKSRSLYFAP